MNNFMLLFIICTAINVIVSTVKSIVTVNGSKFSAAFWNAVGYGFYAYIVVLTAGDGVSTLAKVLITAICNFIGVFIVKWVEQKMRKDKLWEVRLTVKAHLSEALHRKLDSLGIAHNFIPTGPWCVFNCYAETQKQTTAIIEAGSIYDAKMFASETSLM